MVSNRWLEHHADLYAKKEESATDRPDVHQRYRDTALALRELLERREAEAGEVVVNGYVGEYFFEGFPWAIGNHFCGGRNVNVLDSPHPSCSVPVECRIRRRSEQAKGGDGDV